MRMKVLSEKLIYDGWLSLRDCMVELPNGAAESRHMEDHGDAAVVLAYDPERRCAILITQPRLAVFVSGEPPILEAVAGRLDGLSPEDAVRKEAMEEAGLVVDDVQFVSRVWTLPAISTERLWLYLASYHHTDRVEAGGGAADENECIEVHEMPLSEIARLGQAGELTDAKTLILVQALQLRRPELFR